MNKPHRYYIQFSTADLRWLDGFDGELYEWTDSRETAWRFTESEAARKLEHVKKQHPEAFVTIL